MPSVDSIGMFLRAQVSAICSGDHPAMIRKMMRRMM